MQATNTTRSHLRLWLCVFVYECLYAERSAVWNTDGITYVMIAKLAVTKLLQNIYENRFIYDAIRRVLDYKFCQ